MTTAEIMATLKEHAARAAADAKRLGWGSDAEKDAASYRSAAAALREIEARRLKRMASPTSPKPEPGL